MSPAGPRRHLLTLYRMENIRDSTGAVIATPVLHAEGWAEVTPLPGRELFAAGAVQAEIDHRAVFDWSDLPDAKPEMELRDESGAVYDVKAVRNLEGRFRQTELLVRLRP